jgi:hypothetical protein
MAGLLQGVCQGKVQQEERAGQQPDQDREGRLGVSEEEGGSRGDSYCAHGQEW